MFKHKLLHATCAHRHMHAFMHACMYTGTTHARAYMHACMHTHTHTHAHTYTSRGEGQYWLVKYLEKKNVCVLKEETAA